MTHRGCAAGSDALDVVEAVAEPGRPVLPGRSRCVRGEGDVRQREERMVRRPAAPRPSRRARPPRSAAPVSALCSAASSTTGPRHVLMRIAVGFIIASSRGADACDACVSSSGTCRLTTSDVRRSSSSRTKRTPRASSWSSVRRRDVVVLDASRRTRPRAGQPSCRCCRAPRSPGSCRPARTRALLPGLPTRHLPATTSLWNRTSRFRTASISISVCSATAIALAPPLLETGTPALRAASTSTWSYPALRSCTRRSLRGGAEELAAHAPGEAEVVVRLGGRLIKLRGAYVGDHQLESGRRHASEPGRGSPRAVPGRRGSWRSSQAPSLAHCCASGIGGGHARLVAVHARGMSFARGVLDQSRVTGAEDVLGAVAEADLELTGKDDDELPARRRMPVEKCPTGSSRNAICVVASPFVQSGVLRQIDRSRRVTAHRSPCTAGTLPWRPPVPDVRNRREC